MMFQWTDGEVSHIVKLALESVRSASACYTIPQRSRLIEALAGELSASAWHAHTIDGEALDHPRRLPWRTIASDLQHDWSEFCPFEFYTASLKRMLDAVEASGKPAEQVANRTCELTTLDGPYSAERRRAGGESQSDRYHALAWLAISPTGACACVEFLKPIHLGPFSMRDEALVRILSTELLTEPAGAPPRSERPELAGLPRRQREVLTRLLAGSSVKEIALDLGISPYTVNDYIKALYRRYEVSSRGELLAVMHGLRRPAVPK